MNWAFSKKFGRQMVNEVWNLSFPFWCHLVLKVIIAQSVLRQVHSLFQSEFSCECDLVLPLSISVIIMIIIIIIRHDLGLNRPVSASSNSL
jgi:hypothetical protein